MVPQTISIKISRRGFGTGDMLDRFEISRSDGLGFLTPRGSNWAGNIMRLLCSVAIVPVTLGARQVGHATSLVVVQSYRKDVRLNPAS